MQEKELIEGCVEGNQKAYRVLYDSYGPTLMAIANRYTPDSDAAQDVIQEAFIKIFKNISTFENKGSFEGWLKKIVVFTAINYFNKRKSKKENYEFEDWREIQYADESVIDALSAEELTTMIDALPEGYKIVFNLYVVEGYSHDEIAELIGTSSSNSRSQLAKAKKKLKTILEENGVVYHAG
ncbi:MAG: RNA polymerase sigma factor [Lishizhenia sp.]